MKLPESGFINKDQVLHLLLVSRATLYRYIKSGKFPESVKLGRRSLWNVDDIRDWLAKTRSQ